MGLNLTSSPVILREKVGSWRDRRWPPGRLHLVLVLPLWSSGSPFRKGKP